MIKKLLESVREYKIYALLTPLLVACDIYRPAAIDQLEVVGKTVDVPVYVDRDNKCAEDIAMKARKEAEIKGFDVLHFPFKCLLPRESHC